MNSKKKYTPINCSFYDVLESHATIGDWVIIRIRTENEGVHEISDRITNLETRQGEEFLILESGNVYRLDAIVSINGESLNEPSFSMES